MRKARNSPGIGGAALTRATAEVRSWLKALTRRQQLETEMEDELSFHLEQLTADLIRAGHTPREAARRARVAMGSTVTHKEEMRASLGLRWWDEVRDDLRYGVRILRRSPGFTLVAASSLALAIGANTAIFSVARQLLYTRLHVPRPAELQMLRWNGDSRCAVQSMWGDFDTTPGRGITSSVFSYPAYRQMAMQNAGVVELVGFKEDSMNATLRGSAERVDVAMVSGNFYAGMEVRAQAGRAIEPQDDEAAGAGAVAVISDGLWERKFGRSLDALGQVITVNQVPLVIVGVNPRGFTGAKNALEGPEIFVPLSMQPRVDPKGSQGGLLADPEMWWVNVMGRARPGVARAALQAALDVQLTAVVHSTLPVSAGDTMPRLVLVEGNRGLHFGDRIFKRPVLVLLSLTGVVLLLACTNIANLLLARGSVRRREVAVRQALGAGRGRIVRQLMTESLLLAALGGMGGLALGFVGRDLIPHLMTGELGSGDIQINFDWRVFLFTGAVTLLTGLLFGIAPAFAMARNDVSDRLKESTQAASRRRKGAGGKAIVAFQIALSALLVIGAGLFLRTLFKLNALDLGFNADHLLLFEVNPPASRYAAGKDVQLHTKLEERFAALPGVEQATAGETAYISDNMSNADFLPEGENFDGGNGQAEDENSVGVNFFQTMGIPIVAGRSFGPQDTVTSQKVGIINQSLARKRFPKMNPIGRRFRADRDARDDWIEVVGICADTRFANLRDLPPPQFFLPYVQQPRIGGMTYAVRTRMSASALAPALRRVVQSVDRDLPITNIRTQREQVDAAMRMERTFATLTAGFGVLALLLACVGIYGVMAYSVAQRTNEIGIRMALGAKPAQVRQMILEESTGLVAAGLIAGTAAALVLTRMVRSMLYGIEFWDPATLAVGIAVLLAATIAATWIPARRAAGVQPMDALRHE